jgi:flagellar hook-basal body complex protein FliE
MADFPSNMVASAYAASQRFAQPVQPLPSLEGAGEGGSFADLVQQAIGTVTDSGRAADTQSMQAAVGRADMVDVVTAVAESEAALETLVAVRDRVIAAYEDIMRMPI